MELLCAVGKDGCAVGDEDEGTTGVGVHDALCDQGFGLRIQSRSAFVENHNGGFAKQGAGDADALCLPFR